MLRSLRVVRLAGMAALFLAGGLAAAPAVAVHAKPVSTTFTYTGSEQTYVVPPGVTSLTIQANGGHGDNNSCGGLSPADLSNGDGFGGYGASVTATIPVKPNETLYVDPGTDGNGPTGGYTGSSTYQSGGNAGTLDCAGGGGGGYSAVLTCSLLDPTCYVNFWTGSDPRLIVAGGGGGAGGDYGCDGGNAGSDGVGGGNQVCDAGGGGGGNGNGSSGEYADDNDDSGGGGATQSGVGLGGIGNDDGADGSGDIGGNGYTPFSLCLSVSVAADFGFRPMGGCTPQNICFIPTIAADFRENTSSAQDCALGGGGGGGFFGGGGGSSDLQNDFFGAGGGAGSSFATGTNISYADDTSDTPEVIITPNVPPTTLTITSTGTTTGTKTYTFNLTLTPDQSSNCDGSFTGTGGLAGSTANNITLTGNYYGNTVYFLAGYQNSQAYFFGTLLDRPLSPGNATGTGKNSAGNVTQTYVATSNGLFQAAQLSCQDLSLAGTQSPLTATKNVAVTTVLGTVTDPDGFSGVNPDLTVTIGFGDGTPNGTCKGSACFTSSTLPNTIKFVGCQAASAPTIPGGIKFPGTPLERSCQVQMTHIYKATGCFSIGVSVLDSDQTPALSLNPGPVISVGTGKSCLL